MRHPDGRLVHTSKLKGRRRERTPREELSRPVSSLDPYRLCTSEELQFRQPLSRPLSAYNNNLE